MLGVVQNHTCEEEGLEKGVELLDRKLGQGLGQGGKNSVEFFPRQPKIGYWPKNSAEFLKNSAEFSAGPGFSRGPVLGPDLVFK